MSQLTAAEPIGKAAAVPPDAIVRRAVRALTVRWPVDAETLGAVVRGDLAAVAAADGRLGALLDVLRASAHLGDFGLYQDVFEATVGVEGFTPTSGANPSLGSVGTSTLSPTITLTTYLDARLSEETLDEVLAAVVAAHPWQIPVIELSGPMDLVSRSL